MQYFQIENENEDPTATMEYIVSKINWDVQNQSYRIPPEKESELERTTNLSECKIFWRGKFIIIEHNDMVFYWDSEPYNFLRQAAELMEPEKPATWKTIHKLISLRMGIRQTEVNLCGYVESILEGKKMTLNRYREFMRLARAQDLEHHGSHTF